MKEEKSWTVLAFETSREDKLVEKFIKSQQPQTQAKIVHLIDLLQKNGSLLGMPHAKKLTSDLFELRIRGKKEIRIIYCFKRRTIYLLHAFKKQTQKTPKKEIYTALKRFRTLQ